MPKLKTKGSMKRRFKKTASGKFLRSFAFKRHNLRKRSQSMKRKARGTTAVAKTEEKLVLRHAPYL